MAGVLAGVVLGNLLAMTLLRQAANAYGVGLAQRPGMGGRGRARWRCSAWSGSRRCCRPCGPAGSARCRRIAAGRAPRTGRGYAAHRLLRRLRLPRPVTIGLAAPFARPARTAITLVAVLLGAAAVTFAVGLGTSLNRVVGGLSRSASEPVQISRNSQRLVQSSAAAQQRSRPGGAGRPPGTCRYVAETDNQISVAGLTGQHPITAFRGPAGWTGYDMIRGHWYTGPGQAVVPPASSP